MCTEICVFIMDDLGPSIDSNTEDRISHDKHDKK